MYSLMIADDEVMERCGLEMRIQNHFTEIQLLPSASNGIEFLKNVEKYHPDIVIVDIEMPGLTGLEALSLLQSKNLAMKIIINTAYDDFAYIQEAIALGAVGYLLKPIEQQDFTDTLNRAIAMVEKDRRSSMEHRGKQELEAQMKNALEENIITSVILGEPNENSFQLYCQSVTEAAAGCVMIAIALAEDGGVKASRAVISAVEAVIKKELSVYANILMKQYQGNLYLILFPGEGHIEKDWRHWIENIVGIIEEKITDQICVKLHFGISQCKKDIVKMADAFGECNLVLSKEKKISFFEELSIQKYAQIPIAAYVEVIAQQLIQKEISFEKIQEQVHLFAEQLRKERYTVHVASIAALNLVLSVCDYLQLYYGKEGILFSFIQYTKILQDGQELEEVREKTEECISRIHDQLMRKKVQSNYVDQAVLYIERNYQSDISLDEMAEKIGISSFYLSRLIKQQLNLNFIDLLTEVRIHQAILLIRKGRDTVKTIGNNVGYSNTNYFYKVFKKATGMTVGEMRSCFLQIDANG